MGISLLIDRRAKACNGPQRASSSSRAFEETRNDAGDDHFWSRADTFYWTAYKYRTIEITLDAHTAGSTIFNLMLNC